MLIDLIIIGLVVGVAVWGYRRGFSADGLALIGFAVGVVIGSRIAPLALDGGLRDPFAPMLALPGALICGGILAALLERYAHTARRRIHRHPVLDGVAGALVSVCLGLVVVWSLGAVAARVDDFRPSVRESSVIDNLNAVLPPAGPLLAPEDDLDRLPVIAGPPARVGPASPSIIRDPQVRSAAAGVVRVTAVACGHGSSGSGWIARHGTVVTNAHVVAGSDEMRVQVRGEGRLHDAKAILYDPRRDVAILSVPTIGGAPSLPMARRSVPGTLAAVLGFPRGGAYMARAARVGATARIAGRRVAQDFVRRPITSIRAFVRPGNSGGPVVDGEGRVATMVFAGRSTSSGRGGHTAYGVPIGDVRRGLDRARDEVDTGECSEE